MAADLSNGPPPSTDISRFIAGLPKAELHVHLLGSASVDTVLALARRHPDLGVPTDDAELRAFYQFTNFAHFIEVYIAVNALVRSAEDVARLAVGVGADLARQQVLRGVVAAVPWLIGSQRGVTEARRSQLGLPV